MANKNVNILLKLQDQFTRPMREAGNITKQQQKAMKKLNTSVYGFSRSVRTGFTSAIGSVAKFGAALAGISGVLSIGALKSFASESMELAKAQVEAETKLEAVLGNVKSIAAEGSDAILKAKDQLMGVASDIQKVGVIGDEVTLAGMQQLATFQLSADQIAKLSTGMTDLLAQTKGLNATQEDAVSIANLIGKAMNGNAGALTRVGIIMDDNQKKMLESGDATQRAAVLAEILKDNVGGVNAALADTSQGKIQQFSNAWGDMKEEVGKHILGLKAAIASELIDYIPKIQEVALAVTTKVSGYVWQAVGWVKSHSTEIKNAVLGVKDGVVKAWAMIQPVVSFAIKHAQTLIPLILGVVSAISAASVVADVATKVNSGVKAFTRLRKSIKDAGGMMSWLKTGPIGLIIIGIAAAVAAVVYLWNHCEGFRNAVKKAASVIVNAWNNIKTTAVLVKDVAVVAFNVLRDKVTGAFDKIKERVAPVIQWIKDRVDDIKKLIDGIKQFWQDLGTGPWVTNNGGGSGSELHGHATGTPYWRGGLTRINEGGRGEIVDLPSGTRIIPHDVSKQVVSGGNTFNMTFNLNGLMIGTREFMEQTGEYITREIMNAWEVTP